ncbi:MAG TPA: chemotaxis-specific protein-glutamate methyltransferase CheB [Chthoniobacteraceae bacterium]|nr:chemotaxis-specific protein-glutamate methyltransferase CheB [Chthoniobacteraceae bacterium]
MSEPFHPNGLPLAIPPPATLSVAPARKLAVMIIEDSLVVRELLQHIISRDARLEIVASVGSGEAALKLLREVRPDVISLDIRLPGMSGFEATQRIMSERPTPIVVVSSDVEDDELKISMNALRAGALAVVQKPAGLSHADYEALAENLCTKLAIMSQVRVIRQRYGTAAAMPLSRSAPAAEPKARRSSARPRVLGLVASTGGPNALVRLLNELKPGFPAPVLVVQHIAAGFLPGFVRWMDDEVSLPVREAAHGMAMEDGVVYVAPADRHLVATGREELHLTSGAPLGNHRPSGTVLFRSLADAFGPAAVGVLLTGMGDDGALGLKEMYDEGAYTIAEHESSAVVYGMPAAAVKLSAVSEVLPLPRIGERLNRLFSQL